MLPTGAFLWVSRQLNDSIWANWFAGYKLNDVVRGKVSRLTTFGAFVELADGIEGLCHISEIEDRRGRDKEREKKRYPTKRFSPRRPAVSTFKIVKINRRPAQGWPELSGSCASNGGAGRWTITGLPNPAIDDNHRRRPARKTESLIPEVMVLVFRLRRLRIWV